MQRRHDRLLAEKLANENEFADGASYAQALALTGLQEFAGSRFPGFV
jgi:hypothetical protein